MQSVDQALGMEEGLAAIDVGNRDVVLFLAAWTGDTRPATTLE